MVLRNALVLALVVLSSGCGTDEARYATSDKFRRQFRKTGCPALVRWEPILVTHGMVIPGFESCLVMEYWIGTDGVPGQFAVRESIPPDALEAQAVDAMQLWRFEPAAKPTHVVQKLHFSTDWLLADPHFVNDDFLCGPAADRNPIPPFCGPEDSPNERK